MATQAKVIIKGENNISSAVKSASNDLNALKGSVEKIGSVLKTAFSVTAIVTAIKGIGTAAKTVMTEDFGMAERAYRQLALTLKDQSAYDSVVDNINRLAKVTLSGNDEIESMVAELAALGKSSDEINRISEAAVILSNITGRDLKSSMTTLLSSMNGTTTQLKRLGIDLDGVTKEALEQGAAIDILIEDYGEYSSALAEDSVNQSLKNISEIVKRLYKSENMKRLFPDSRKRLEHIFEKQVFGLAPTEIIYRITLSYILGFSDDFKIEKHNIRKCDSLALMKENRFEQELVNLFGAVLSE